MKPADQSPTSVYHYPRYYAIGYQWNTKAECDFLEACVTQFMGRKANSVLDIGCGAGRHLLELAQRGYRACGFDLRPEMITFVREEARKAGLSVTAHVGDLRHPQVEGTFDLAICVMDTFRFLLTNAEIIDHLQYIGDHLSPGGLYLVDFWIPTKWDQMANEIYQWEQTQEETTVRVFYLQHPESVDPVSQTFEDELVFEVRDGGQTKTIHGERTRTRLIMPQEFSALIQASGSFDVVGTFSDFDLEKSLESSCISWRMISVLRKHDAAGLTPHAVG